MDQMKVSSFLPLGLMLLSNRIDFEEPQMRQILQIVFFCVSLCNMLVLAWAYKSIQEVPSSAPKVSIPEKVQFGQVVQPAEEVTAQEHDVRSLKEKLQQVVVGSFFVYFIFYKWEKALPLLMQGAMMPCQLVESPLFQVHVLKRPASDALARPWKTPNPLEALMEGAKTGDATKSKSEKKAEKKEEKKKK
jgi:hypothetical protein